MECYCIKIFYIIKMNNTLLVLVKLKDRKNYESYTEPMFFRVLDNVDYHLIDILTDPYNNKLYYYFNGPNGITDYHYYDIYKSLRDLIPDYAYIKKMLPKKKEE